jgi:hypothetical protein
MPDRASIHQSTTQIPRIILQRPSTSASSIYWPVAAVRLTRALDPIHIVATSPLTPFYVAAAAKNVQF